jgi:hypothetical protein
VRLLRGGGRLRVAFDDSDLVSNSGLAPAMELAEACDLHGIVAEHVRTEDARQGGDGPSDTGPGSHHRQCLRSFTW